jgi:hypothetical protein
MQAARLVGGRRTRTAKSSSSSDRFAQELKNLTNRFSTNDFTSQVKQIQILRGDQVSTCTATQVLYFRESHSFYVATTTSICSITEQKYNKFQRRLFDTLKDKKLIVLPQNVPDNVVTAIVFSVSTEQWRLCPVSIYPTSTGFFCLGDFTMRTGREIELKNAAPVEEPPKLVPVSTGSGITDSNPSQVSDNEIDLIMSQTGCSREEAISALSKNMNDIVGAIMSLST